MFLKNIIISLCFFPVLTFSQGIQFFEGSFDKLKEEAKKQNKIIFIDCYTSWCGPCKWMTKNVFPDPKVGEFYNSNFISFKMDMEKGEGKEVRKIYGVNAFPTLLFINGDGEIENRSLGACDTAEFIRIGKRTLDRENNFGALLRKYKEGDRTPDFLAKYALACANINVSYDIREYFATQTDSSLLSEKNFILMEWYLTDIKSKEFKFLVDNKFAYSQMLNAERVEGRIIEIFRKNAMLVPTENKNKSLSGAVSEMISPFNMADSLEIKYRILMEFYGKGKYKDIVRFEKYVDSYCELVGTDKMNPPILFDIINTINYSSNDTVSLQRNTEWCDILISKGYSLPEVYLSKAKTYRRLGDIKNAKLFADKALVEEQKKINPNNREIQKFLQELNEVDQKK